MLTTKPGRVTAPPRRTLQVVAFLSARAFFEFDALAFAKRIDVLVDNACECERKGRRRRYLE